MAQDSLTTEVRRNSARQRVLMVATLFAPGGVSQVRVRDFSSAGARIVSQRPIERSIDVIFKRGRTFVAARVIWSNGCEAGLQFYRALTRAEF